MYDDDDLFNDFGPPGAPETPATPGDPRAAAMLRADDKTFEALLDAGLGRSGGAGVPDAASEELRALAGILREHGGFAAQPQVVDAPTEQVRVAVEWDRLDDSQVAQLTESVLSGTPLPDTAGPELSVWSRQMIADGERERSDD